MATKKQLATADTFMEVAKTGSLLEIHEARGTNHNTRHEIHIGPAGQALLGAFVIPASKIYHAALSFMRKSA